MPPQFIYHRRVQFVETDMAGIMHFSNFYRYMEEAEHAYFRSLGLKIMQTQHDGTVIGWPRVRCSCTYDAPARYDDDVEIRLTVTRKGVRSVTYEMEFWREGERLARGSMKTVCCLCHPDSTLESVDIPPHYSDLIIESPEAKQLSGD